MPTYKFQLRQLGIEKRISFKPSRWPAVERTRDRIVSRLKAVAEKDSKAAALKLWSGGLEEELQRSGNAKRRGENLTTALRLKGGRTRGRQLRRDTEHQRDAQRAQAASRSGKLRLSTERAALKTRRALREADDYELELFNRYLQKRQQKRRRVDWDSRPPPRTEEELEWYLLDKYHFCNSFREDDPTTDSFKKALAKTTDGFGLFCSAVVHAVLPNWRWYSLLVRSACGSLVFDPRKLKTTHTGSLTKQLSEVVDGWVNTHNGAKFWSPMPYITLASSDDSKPRQLANLMLLLQRDGAKLYKKLVLASEKLSVNGLSAQVRESISENSLGAMVKDKTLFGVSWFTAYQALVTFSGVQNQASVLLYDPDVHAIAGNGALGALKRFFSKDIHEWVWGYSTKSTVDCLEVFARTRFAEG